MAAVDACLVILALAAAQWLSLSMTGRGFAGMSGIVLLCRFVFTVAATVIFSRFGFYAQLWCYASIPQFAGLAAGVTAATLLLPLCDYLTAHLQPPAYYILFWMVLVLLLTFFRLSLRLFSGRLKSLRDKQLKNAPVVASGQAVPAVREIRIMIIGAGYAASQIIRELAETESRYRPVVLIDDDPDKRSRHLRQVAIIGDHQQIRQAVTQYRIDEMILAIPDAPYQLVSELISISRQTGCPLKILPRLSDLINGRISVLSTRQVTVEDLLGRQAQDRPEPGCAAGLAGAVVFVTGGGGSVGAELCRQIAACGPKRLIVFDIYENNAYELQQELLARYGASLDLAVLIGTVCDSERLDELMCLYQPDIIFHAAACKQAPLMQENPGEAVKTNLFGTYQTALAAARSRVGRFILLSTVSAGNPSGVMDATLRLAEMTIQSLGDLYPATVFTAVRFSNVLGSNGSVVPLFQRQIRQLRRITVTHPDSRRCFITLKEAAQLVIQAGACAPAGAICIQSRHDKIRIADLAADLIRLSGLEPGSDVAIDYTGLRPGEKLTDDSFTEHGPRNEEAQQRLFTLLPETEHRGGAAEIDRLEQLIGWSSHALRKHLAWLRTTVKPAAGLPVQETSQSKAIDLQTVDHAHENQKTDRTDTRRAADCSHGSQSAIYTLETKKILPAQMTKTEVI
jgi:FlaA1/EpsC-like NDP-sugar epimerase